MLKKLAVIFILILFSKITFAQETKVNLIVTPNNLTVGSTIDYIVSIEMKQENNLVKAPVKKDFLNDTEFTFIDSSNTKEISNNLRNISLNYKISTFTLGEQFIPTQSIVIKNTVTNKFSKYILPAYPIYVAAVSDLNDTQNLSVKVSDSLFFELKLDIKYILFLILIIIVCIILCILLYRYFKNKNTKTNESAIVEKQIDPYELFLKQINNNFEQQETIEIKDYYVNFSEIIKTFLSHVLNQNTIELTSVEIYNLSQEILNEQDFRRLKSVLSFSDQVKFAKYIPSIQENKEYLDKAIETITKINQNYLQDISAEVKKEDTQS